MMPIIARVLRRGITPHRRLSLRVFTVLTLWLLTTPFAAAAEIVATSDRDPVSLLESFELSFSADDSPDGDPAFSPLEQDFQVLSQGQSTQINMINGRLQRRTEWKLTVMAKRAGTLSVPAIAFGRDRSRPFSLTVLPGRTDEPRASGDEPLLLEVEAEPKNPYVQAQVVFTIRMLHRIALRNGQLDDPKLLDAVVEKLGEDRRYQTERNGHLYGVIERRFAIFPQKSGALRIEPIGLTAELSAGPGSMFDQFFGRQGRIQKIESDPVVLQVRPVPAAFKGKHWLPAASLKLEEAWSIAPPETKVGEPITRTLSLHAEGVTMGMLPELTDKTAAPPAQLKRYPDQPSLSEEPGARGLTGTRREKTAFIPMKEGDYPVPGTEIPWWNTRADRLEIARIPESVIKALPAPIGSVPQSAQAAAPETVPPDERGDTPASAATPSVAQPPVDRSDLWFWLTWALAAGWLGTALVWWRQTRAASKRVAEEDKPTLPDRSKSLQSLQRAAAARDPKAMREAVLDWAAAQWPERPPTNLEQIAVRLGGPAQHALTDLNRVLYGQSSAEWPADELFRLIAEASADRKRHRRERPEEAGLTALYRG